MHSAECGWNISSSSIIFCSQCTFFIFYFFLLSRHWDKLNRSRFCAYGHLTWLIEWFIYGYSFLMQDITPEGEWQQFWSFCLRQMNPTTHSFTNAKAISGWEVKWLPKITGLSHLCSSCIRKLLMLVLCQCVYWTSIPSFMFIPQMNSMPIIFFSVCHRVCCVGRCNTKSE